MSKGSICLVSTHHGEIEWLEYEMVKAGWEVTLLSEEEVQGTDLRHFTYVVFNLSGFHTRNEVEMRLEKVMWPINRTIARFDFGHAFHGVIKGLHALDLSETAQAYLSLLEPVRA